MSQGLELPVGYYVRYVHYRFYVDKDNEPITMAAYRRGESKWFEKGMGPHPRGGATLASVYNSEDDVVAVGKADCSVVDAFCYKRGMMISRGRALKKLREKRGVRRGGGVLPRGPMPLDEYARAAVISDAMFLGLETTGALK